MPETLKKCPFCGREGWATQLEDPQDFFCDNRDCRIFGLSFTKEEWNSRPLEDALQNRVHELEAMDPSEHPHYQIPDGRHAPRCKCGADDDFPHGSLCTCAECLKSD